MAKYKPKKRPVSPFRPPVQPRKKVSHARSKSASKKVRNNGARKVDANRKRKRSGSGKTPRHGDKGRKSGTHRKARKLKRPKVAAKKSGTAKRGGKLAASRAPKSVKPKYVRRKPVSSTLPRKKKVNREKLLKTQLEEQARELEGLKRRIAAMTGTGVVSIVKEEEDGEALLQYALNHRIKPTDITKDGEEYYKRIARLTGRPENEIYSTLLGSPGQMGVTA